MANRKTFYFREKVTDAELNSAFDDLENADRNLAADLGNVGVVANAVVSQHAPTSDLTVDLSGPGIIYDQLGQRIFFSALQNVRLGQDNNGVSTDVSAAGKEKIVSISVKFDRALSDPRIDGDSKTVFFRQDETLKFVFDQGSESYAGGAIPPPFLSDAILLADITRRFNQPQIVNADISTARRQDAVVVIGKAHSIRRGRVGEAISDLSAIQNAHFSGNADRHSANAINFVRSGALSSNNVQAAIVELDGAKAGLAAANRFTDPGVQVIEGSLQVEKAIFTNGIIQCAGQVKPTDPLVNAIVANSFCKLWVTFFFQPGSISLLNGINVASVELNGGVLRVNFASQLNSWAAWVSSTHRLFYGVGLGASPSCLNIEFSNPTTGQLYNMSDPVIPPQQISVLVFGTAF